MHGHRRRVAAGRRSPPAAHPHGHCCCQGACLAPTMHPSACVRCCGQAWCAGGGPQEQQQQQGGSGAWRRRRGVRGPARRSHVSACPTTAALALPLHPQVPATHMHVLARAGVMGCLQGGAAWQDRSPNCCPPPPAGRDPCPSPASAPADAVLVPRRSRSTRTLPTS